MEAGIEEIYHELSTPEVFAWIRDFRKYSAWKDIKTFAEKIYGIGRVSTVRVGSTPESDDEGGTSWSITSLVAYGTDHKILSPDFTTLYWTEIRDDENYQEYYFGGGSDAQYSSWEKFISCVDKGQTNTEMLLWEMQEGARDYLNSSDFQLHEKVYGLDPSSEPPVPPTLYRKIDL